MSSSDAKVAEKLITEANALFVDENYAAALEQYTAAIKAYDKNSTYYTQRCFCHFKLGKFTEAMSDARKALDLDPNDAKAYLRKGMAAFSLEEFESAKEAFEQSQKLAPDSRTKTWIRKCDAELDNDNQDEEDDEHSDFLPPPLIQQDPKPTYKKFGVEPPPLEPDIKPKLRSLKPKITTTPATSSFSSTSTSKSNSISTSTSASTSNSTSNSASASASASTSTNTKPTPTNPSPRTTPETKEPEKTSPPLANQQESAPSRSKVRYEWYQTETHVTVSIYLKNVKKEDANVTFKPEDLEVEVKLPNSTEYQLGVELSDRIVPEESSYMVLGSKIEIKMKKSRVAKWLSLENKGSQVQAWDIVQDPSREKGLVYPTSSKHGTKNWDTMVKKKPRDVDSMDGDTAMNKLLKDVFRNGSDEQRRAMMKSMSESCGTVLSTNWSEVGKEEVKVQNPKGVDVKKWKDLYG